MSSPPRVIRPVSGCSKPAIIRRVVVFPDPDGPSRVKNSPSPTCRSTPSTATTSPYVLRAPSTATSANAAREDVEAAVEVLVGDAEGHEDADHVPVDATREEEQALLARFARDASRRVAALLGQLEREHRADPSHVRSLRCH